MKPSVIILPSLRFILCFMLLVAFFFSVLSFSSPSSSCSSIFPLSLPLSSHPPTHLSLPLVFFLFPPPLLPPSPPPPSPSYVSLFSRNSIHTSSFSPLLLLPAFSLQLRVYKQRNCKQTDGGAGDKEMKGGYRD